MDTTPTRRRSQWTANPHQTIPEELAAALRTMRGHRSGRLGPALLACREADWGVPALAVALGMKPAAVAQRIHRARVDGVSVDLSDLTIPPASVSADRHPASAPAGPELPAGCAQHLRELHGEASKVRGNLAADDPRRLASEHLALDMDYLLRTGYRKVRIAQALGVTYRAIDQRLEVHQLRKPAPSAANRRRRYVHTTPGRCCALIRTNQEA